MEIINNTPALRTNRNWLKYYLLSLITLNIYGIVVMSHISTEINQIATKNDGKHTMHYCLLVFIFSWLTLGIAPLVWAHRISNRIGDELSRRKIPYQFSAMDFWLWNILGACIVIGPFVYTHRLMTAMNLLNKDFNQYGY